MWNNNNDETTWSPKTFHQRLVSLKWRKPDRQNQPAPPDSHRGNKKKKTPPLWSEMKKLLSFLLDKDLMPVDENNSKQADALRCEVCVLSADDEKKKNSWFSPLCSFIFFIRLISSVFVNEWVPVVHLQLSGCKDPTAMSHRIIKSHLHHITVRTRSPSVNPFTKKAWDK